MATIHYPDWKEKVVFAPDRPRPQVLMENERLKVVLAGLEAGQKIPPHPEVQGVFTVLEGNGWMVLDAERIPISQGTIVYAPPGSVRGFEATTRLVFLAVRVT